tara:strand:- start:14601 stop:15257 length:657 start_codon:yes stop_codon:yes gene_type:complete
MRVLAIIPARKSSKRLKNKNFKNFNGKPLIYWTIQKALRSKYIDQVLVSTDSEVILKYCKKFSKVVVSRRPNRLAKDNSLIEDVLKYELTKKKFKKFDYFILLQPTSPLRTLKTIEKSLKISIQNNINSCVSFLKKKINLVNLYQFKNKKIINTKFNYDKSKFKYFSPSGDIYICKIKYFLKTKKIIFKDTYPIFVNRNISDIDDEKDFKLAEIKHKN